ncbi:hypothetical protein GF339_04720 [candidate division KSB3 bacterium]|uniref:Golvesin/Xly CBD-like domain-containing protein n=1 Tax=candidate division KSB3 bacterium TaxID=2044937 RepID=A0A9D5Q517_9BACT|nr:hypothetical protein [candidate division KSB3 bacterium]MBD3323863.1 hypothetical protein [candidate division KSB3 bacterium]
MNALNINKMTAVVLVLCLTFFLQACGDGGGDNETEPGISNGNDSSVMLIDDGDPGFTKSDPPENWQQGDGYNGDAYWAPTSVDLARHTARWTPTLPRPGVYRLYAYIPKDHSTTTHAQYNIFANGVISIITLNQSLFADEWVLLGAVTFAADGNEYVELRDLTGESGREIAFDAIMWEE